MCCSSKRVINKNKEIKTCKSRKNTEVICYLRKKKQVSTNKYKWQLFECET